MAQRSLLPDYALRHYVRMFQLGDVVEVGDYRGDTTEQLLLTTQGQYLLRVVQDRTLSDARFEESLIFYLCANGLPVLPMLEAGVKGAVLPVGPRQQLSVFAAPRGRRIGVFETMPSHMRQLGRFMGAMHHAVRRLRRRRRNIFDLSRIQNTLMHCLEQTSDSHRSILTLLHENLADYPDMDRWQRGIVHGDMIPNHVRFVLGELSEVNGFQRACTGPLLLDLAYALIEWAFVHDAFQSEIARSIAQSYLQVRPIPHHEQEMLFTACCYAALTRAVECFARCEMHELPPGLYRDYLHYVKRWDALRTLGARRFFRYVLEGADTYPAEDENHVWGNL